MKKKVTIGITRTISSDEKFQKYVDFLYRFDQTADVIILTATDAGRATIDRCDGVMLTGGDDVHPTLYGRLDLLALAQDPDERRDAFECAVIDRVLQRGLPLLGICRGLQIVNAFLGGTLHGDLQSAGFENHASGKGTECTHRVHVVEGSRLQQQIGGLRGTVNSYHHQAAENVAPPLTVSALSPDGVIEALEWKEPLGRGYLMLVQWHPERMMDEKNPLMREVGNLFLQSMNKTLHT
ncbi:MAG: gamma-glutamyl-gamma-aminobutyrate hydrolase family protein [Ignavibacteriales bacterium]|nr:gamma-glutamyl-gamma-aminobutyrate hydrolase family protein [Ignavibacteriales bacterium]